MLIMLQLHESKKVSKRFFMTWRLIFNQITRILNVWIAGLQCAVLYGLYHLFGFGYVSMNASVQIKLIAILLLDAFPCITRAAF